MIMRNGGSHEAIDAAAKRIELERAPEVKRVQSIQALPPKVLLRKTWWAEALRQLPRLLRYAPVQWLAGRLAKPMMSGTTEVTLKV